MCKAVFRAILRESVLRRSQKTYKATFNDKESTITELKGLMDSLWKYMMGCIRHTDTLIEHCEDQCVDK